MTSPSPSADLSKLRINRDAPPPRLRRALWRNVALALGALTIFLGAFIALRRGGAVPVQAVVAAPVSSAGGTDTGAGAGATSVTANGCRRAARLPVVQALR